MNISFLIANLGVRGSIRRIIELSNRLLLRGVDARIYHSDGSKCQWLTGYAPTFPETQALVDKHDALIFFGDPQHWDMVKRANAKVKALYVLGLNEKADLHSILFGIGPVDSRTQAIRDCLRRDDITILANCTALAEFFEGVGIECYPVVGAVNFDLFYQRKIQRDPKMILAGGAKRDIEGTSTVLEVVAMLKKSIPDIRLELYAKKGYSQDYLATLYSQAGVFLDCQRYGGWNNPVAEAMACRAPVVCTDLWGNRDFAVNKVTAMVSDDPVKLARAVHLLMTDNALAAQMADLAYMQIKPFTWDETTNQLMTAMETEWSK